jgi:hypothetical protein
MSALGSLGDMTSSLRDVWFAPQKADIRQCDCHGSFGANSESRAVGTCVSLHAPRIEPQGAVFRTARVRGATLKATDRQYRPAPGIGAAIAFLSRDFSPGCLANL